MLSVRPLKSNMVIKITFICIFIKNSEQGKWKILVLKKGFELNELCDKDLFCANLIGFP